MNLPPIRIEDYMYELPSSRIAEYPLADRDASKLLVFNHNNVEHKKFSQLPDLLPDNSILFFNDTKVIPARILFHKETGAAIEIFLLQPILPSALLSVTMAGTGKSMWRCSIGNLKRWKNDIVLRKNLGEITLNARLVSVEENLVEFSWKPQTTKFAEIIAAAGAVPLPPYIKRDPEAADRERYQTVYSQEEGAVAAPTAGLHFTEKLLRRLRDRGIMTNFLTLHVSAGTFMPVKEENAVEHTMHSEQIVIQRQTLEYLLIPGKNVIAVGTTAMRTLESLYWYGVLLIKNPSAQFEIDKLIPYQIDSQSIPNNEAFNAVLSLMTQNGVDKLTGTTSIFIFPGYRFRVCQGLITNFHQPGSTLLLLIAAFAGRFWKKIYREALTRDYRFLSYGDSSLLIP